MTNQLTIQSNNTLLVPPPEKNVIALAARMSKVYPQPADNKLKLTDADFVVSTERALALGLNPMSVTKEFHVWKDRMGNLNFQLHFARNARWAQSVEPFRIVEREWTVEEKAASPGVNEKDFVWDVVLIRQSQERNYNAILKTILGAALGAGREIDEAMKLAEKEAIKCGVRGVGVVKYIETYTQDGQLRRGGPGIIPGREPGHARAKIRGLNDAIRKAYGQPTMQDMLGLGLQSQSGDLSEDLLDMPEEITIEKDDIQQRYLELKAHHDEVVALLEEMSPEERRENFEKNVEDLRGDTVADDPEWLDEDGPEEVADAEIIEDDGPEAEDGISVGAMRNAMHQAGYPSSTIQDRAVPTIFGDGATLETLNDVQKHNLVQLMARIQILADTSIEPAERLQKIPEIVRAEADKPTTLKDAKAFLKKLAEAEAANNTKMKELT